MSPTAKQHALHPLVGVEEDVGEEPADEWHAAYQRFIGYYVALFVPWDGPRPRPLTEATLRAFLHDPGSFIPPGTVWRDDLLKHAVPQIELHMRATNDDRHISHLLRQYRIRSWIQWGEEAVTRPSCAGTSA